MAKFWQKKFKGAQDFSKAILCRENPLKHTGLLISQNYLYNLCSI
jgi:hypothetical protein